MSETDGSNEPQAQRRSIDRAGETHRRPATDERPALKRYDGVVPNWAGGEEHTGPSAVARRATALVHHAEREVEAVVDELARFTPGRGSGD